MSIKQLRAEISLLKVELANTELAYQKLKAEYSATYLVNLGGVIVDRMQVEEDLFWADFDPEEDDYWEYLGKLYCTASEEHIQEIGRHRDIILGLKDLPQECCSIFISLEEKREQLAELEDKASNRFMYLLEMLGNLF
ncbi:hypothetical protein H6G33_09700 [Calothrix sp. FACHB-1219]|uniref:hypothetical protein n=1 Tax=unclassified Calothrix TaxID=2619626 RepID=UPI0016826066|nr:MULTISPECIES: hypothetical protein [unclassified Calothrix]MBD2201621.1 hypothetical protein [Calothrix sp. FACHB-168]MBD2217307.1 hypothetical protein [Calothrix sp. FACHB-1219]